jgi:signal transduction histidine kinase
MPDTIGDEPFQRLVAEIVDARRSDVLRVFAERLGGPDGAGQRRVPDQILEQAAAVLNDIVLRARGALPDPPYAAAEDSPAAESSRRSGLLFRTAIQTVVADLPEGPDAVLALAELACVAHESTVYRLTFAAGGYASYLLDRLHHSHVDERRRVARELHDIIAHSVAVALQDLELFTVRRQHDADRAEAKLAAATENLRDTLEMLRAITQDLRRSAAESGLTPALKSYLETAGFDRATSLRVEGDETQVSPAVRGELFLVLREALRNAHVHASPTLVRTTIEIDADAVRAVVADDGRGFDPAERGAGTGLASMRERVALLGGVIEVRSLPGDGTSVSVWVPLART